MIQFVPPMETYPILRFFQYEHLPEGLRATSQKFSELAYDIVLGQTFDISETNECLRKLLEAKDCAVRARISP